MGACSFMAYGHGKNPGAGYKDAVDEAIYDYGHDPYNGTISTTSGFVMIPREEDESYEEWARRVIEDSRVQKWQDCACTAGNSKEEWVFAGWAAT